MSACTSGSQPAEPTAPPEVFAPTPTIGELAAPTTTRPTPNTTVDVERTSVYPVDPIALEALPGFEPIPMGDWAWGVSSPDGRWLALSYAQDAGRGGGVQLAGVRLIEVPQWEMVGDWPQLDSGPMTVTNDGTVYAMSYAGSLPQLVRAGLGAAEPEAIADLPARFSPLDQPRLQNDRLLLIGQAFEAGSALGSIGVVSVDLASGDMVETPIPEVTFGPTEVVELEGGQTGVIDSYPAFIWDEPQSSYFIVHPIEDSIVEFDTISGSITEHHFGKDSDLFSDIEISQDQLNGADLWASHRRSAVLGSGSQVIFVSGAIGSIIEADQVPVSTSTPAGIVAIDTATWEIVDHLDVPVSDLYISPDGHSLIAAGYTEEFVDTGYEFESFGLYVIDPTNLEVVMHHPAGLAEDYLGPVTFSENGALAYVTRSADVESVYVIDVETGKVLNERDNLRVLGEVEAVAAWSE